MLALIASAPAAVGCAATPNEDAASSESDLVAHTRLDRVTPDEVAAAYMAKLRPDLERCVAGNPAIANVDKGNLKAFYRPGATAYYDVSRALDAMLAEPSVTSIPVAGIADAVEAWAKRTLSTSVDAEGFYVRQKGGWLTFVDAEVETREAKALKLAARPGGKDLSEIRAQWAEVQKVNGSSDTEWYNPVKVNGEPTLGAVKKLMGVRYGASQSAWGTKAVDEFHALREDPEFEPLAEFMKSSAIKKRWMFSDGGDEWNHQWLIVLDEHNQLWGVSIGYSE
ncbi:MAG TPA: hypothetical protein VM925_09820 [Labilithrix sp.]|nr:hypothetical protein [Labilithrix sp.]